MSLFAFHPTLHPAPGNPARGGAPWADRRALRLVATVAIALAALAAATRAADIEAPAPGFATPVAESPVAGSPVAGSPVAGSPVAESPVAESPVAESPVAESPVAGLAGEPPAAEDAQDAAGKAAGVESAVTEPDAPETAGEPLPRIVGLDVGFGGYWKAGLWTPARITLEGAGRETTVRVQVVAPDGDGLPVVFSALEFRSEHEVPGDDSSPGASQTDELRLAPLRRRVVEVLVRAGRVRAPWEVQLIVASDRGFAQLDRRVVRRRFEPVDQPPPGTGRPADGQAAFRPGLEHRALYVVVSPSPVGLEEAVRLHAAAGGEPPVVVQLPTADSLPRRDWLGYEGVDAVVLATSRDETYRALADNPLRRGALEQWVRLGGKLILCAGRSAAEATDESAALGGIVPGVFERTVALRRFGALETYSGGSSPVPRPSGDGAIPAARIRAADDAVVEAREADLPLVVRRAEGFGELVFVAVDLDEPPISQWADRGRFVERLMALPAGGAEPVESGAAVMHHGYRDLAGRLRAAVDRFDGIHPISFSTVAVVAVIYILLIGPADYFLLQRFARRMIWTWVTFPAVLLLVVGAVVAAVHATRGNQVRLTQLDLVDVDVASGAARGTTWASLWSPRTDRYAIDFQPPGDPESTKTQNGTRAGHPPQAFDPAAIGGEARNSGSVATWLGLPGSGLGGMSAPGFVAAWTDLPYDNTAGFGGMFDVPVAVRSTKSLTARWWSISQRAPRARLRLDADLLAGEIENTLPVALEDCALFHRRWVYRLGTLRPGTSAEIDYRVPRGELRTFLTGRREAADSRRESDRAPAASPDVPQPSWTEAAAVVRSMMFFEAAGGSSSTAGLCNHYQAFVDLSGALRAGRAVLVARPAAGIDARRWGGTFRSGGAALGRENDTHEAIFRFVLPVEP